MPFAGWIWPYSLGRNVGPNGILRILIGCSMAESLASTQTRARRVLFLGAVQVAIQPFFIDIVHNFVRDQEVNGHVSFEE